MTIDPVVAVMVLLGIGGGFVGLCWGWLVGEQESFFRRFNCNYGARLRLAAECSRNLGISSDEALRALIGFSALIVGAGTVDRLKLSAEIGELAPGAVRLPIFESNFLAPGAIMGVPRSFTYRETLEWPTDLPRTTLGRLFDPNGHAEERHPLELPVDAASDADKVDAPGSVSSPRAAPADPK